MRDAKSRRAAPRLLLGALAMLVLALGIRLEAQSAVTFRYFYDDAGQLQKVMDSTGIAIEYVYDAAGNILEIRRSNAPPAGLQIFTFTPGQGPSQTVVTIRGQGFSDTLADNIVRFNGVVSSLVSATSEVLVARVPTGASTGPISVTVASTTVASASNFVVVNTPVITSVSPAVIDVLKAPAALQVTGTGLTAASFGFQPLLSPPAVAVGSPVINPDGTSAVLPITVAGTVRGRFTLVATNASGSSEPFPSNANSIWLITAQDDTDSDGDGFPDGLEALYGSDPMDAESVPDMRSSGSVLSAAIGLLNTGKTLTSQELLGAAFSVANTLLPPELTTQAIFSAAFSVANTFSQSTGAQTLVSPALSLLNKANLFTGNQAVGPAVSILNALSGNAQPQQLDLGLPRINTSGGSTAFTKPLSASLEGLTAGQQLIEGQTVAIRATVQDNDGKPNVTFTVNGQSFATDNAAPYAMTFTVPSGVTSLRFAAEVTDEGGRRAATNSIETSVERDALTAVSGRVVDGSGTPVAGAAVELLSEGLRAEFFDSSTPLPALPNLSAAAPNRSTRVTAINLRGPASVLGVDPLGTGLAPDYSARFSGWIRIPAAGEYTFYLGADEGARLRLNNTTVFDVPASGSGYQEGTATVRLTAGLVPIEISFYESVGNAQLQLSIRAPGGEREVVLPSSLVPSVSPFVAVSDADGRFVLQGIPTALAQVAIRASATVNGTSLSATSSSLQLIGSGTQSVEIVLTLTR